MMIIVFFFWFEVGNIAIPTRFVLLNFPSDGYYCNYSKCLDSIVYLQIIGNS